MKRLFAWAGVALAIAALLFGIDAFRHRYVRHSSDLTRLLPPGDLNLIYADIDVLRRADLLGLVANIKVAPDKEYDAFVAETGFDYTRDLDAIAVATGPVQTFLIGRGRFHWDKLEAFAKAHGGMCQGDACRAAGSTPGRWVNFIHIQPDVLGVAISPSETGADELRPPGRRVQEEVPADPIWARPSHELLTHPTGLPTPLQIFAIDLQSAQSVTLSANLKRIQMKGRFENAAAAATARSQFEIQTKRLSHALQQANEKLGRDSIGGLLTAGSYQVIGTELDAEWPIYPELIRALQ